MAKKAIVLHPEDNVATVLEKIPENTEIEIELAPNKIERLTTTTKINFLHKVALKDIPEGSPVIKYGQIIGKATTPIQKGSHIHTKNLKSWFYS
ncbi:MAG: D-galactarate dehydratase [Promethearchaeota archaeon]|nr:MAG: D-galactarate dehydratase [Candidatus Lokiarchaeota archaeon]